MGICLLLMLLLRIEFFISGNTAMIIGGKMVINGARPYKRLYTSMALAHVVQVGRIGDGTLSVGQHQAGMTSNRFDPGRITFAARHSDQHLQQPHENRRRAGGVLSDHVKHSVRQPVVVYRRDYKRHTVVSQPDPGV